jgi:hypothetical protein
LGILLIINGVGYFVETLAVLLLQRSDYEAVHRFTFVTYFGEAAIMLWYIIKGVRTNIPTIDNNNECTTMRFVQ